MANKLMKIHAMPSHEENANQNHSGGVRYCDMWDAPIHTGVLLGIPAIMLPI